MQEIEFGPFKWALFYLLFFCQIHIGCQDCAFVHLPSDSEKQDLPAH